MYERFVEYGVNDAVYRMLYHTVSKCGRIDFSLLGFIHRESEIRARFIKALMQFLMQSL